MALVNKKINAPSGVDDELWGRAMDTYMESERVKKYEQQKNAAENAVSGYTRNPALTGVQDKILNRPKFNYDYSTDPLYLQYKDQYQRHGQKAMTDTMAQAAALTGGYGNSYAASAGQQTYNSYMQDLNAIMPELYDRAAARYDAEGNELYNMYNMLYGEERDTLGDLRGDRDYYSNAYRAEAADDYSKFSDNRSAAMSLSQMQNGDWWDKTKFEYQKEQDAAAAALAREQFEYQKQQDALNRAAASASAKSSGGSGSDGGESVKLYRYAGQDGDKRLFYNSDDKLETYDVGINPYTGGMNDDVKKWDSAKGKWVYDPNKAFSNGYQPNNLGGNTMHQSGLKDNKYGREQNVYVDGDGDGALAWYWNGKDNKYEAYCKNGKQLTKLEIEKMMGMYDGVGKGIISSVENGLKK